MNVIVLKLSETEGIILGLQEHSSITSHNLNGISADFCSDMMSSHEIEMCVIRSVNPLN